MQTTPPQELPPQMLHKLDHLADVGKRALFSVETPPTISIVDAADGKPSAVPSFVVRELPAASAPSSSPMVDRSTVAWPSFEQLALPLPSALDADAELELRADELRERMRKMRNDADQFAAHRSALEHDLRVAEQQQDELGAVVQRLRRQLAVQETLYERRRAQLMLRVTECDAWQRKLRQQHASLRRDFLHLGSDVTHANTCPALRADLSALGVVQRRFDGDGDGESEQQQQFQDVPDNALNPTQLPTLRLAFVDVEQARSAVESHSFVQIGHLEGRASDSFVHVLGVTSANPFKMRVLVMHVDAGSIALDGYMMTCDAGRDEFRFMGVECDWSAAGKRVDPLHSCVLRLVNGSGMQLHTDGLAHERLDERLRDKVANMWHMYRTTLWRPAIDWRDCDSAARLFSATLLLAARPGAPLHSNACQFVGQPISLRVRVVPRDASAPDGAMKIDFACVLLQEPATGMLVELPFLPRFCRPDSPSRALASAPHRGVRETHRCACVQSFATRVRWLHSQWSRLNWNDERKFLTPDADTRELLERPLLPTIPVLGVSTHGNATAVLDAARALHVQPAKTTPAVQPRAHGRATATITKKRALVVDSDAPVITKKRSRKQTVGDGENVARRLLRRNCEAMRSLLDTHTFAATHEDGRLVEPDECGNRPGEKRGNGSRGCSQCGIANSNSKVHVKPNHGKGPLLDQETLFYWYMSFPKQQMEVRDSLIKLVPK